MRLFVDLCEVQLSFAVGFAEFQEGTVRTLRYVNVCGATVIRSPMTNALVDTSVRGV